jgi:predicted nucleic acid-binding protein
VASLLLDTTVLIDVLRGRPGTVERLGRAIGARETLWTCAVNVEETVRGLRQSEAGAAQLLFDGLRIAPLGREQGALAGAWRRAFADRGVTLAQADCLVAAAAAGVGATLATGNPKDFPMDDVAVEVWEPVA